MIYYKGKKAIPLIASVFPTDDYDIVYTQEYYETSSLSRPYDCVVYAGDKLVFPQYSPIYAELTNEGAIKKKGKYIDVFAELTTGKEYREPVLHADVDLSGLGVKITFNNGKSDTLIFGEGGFRKYFENKAFLSPTYVLLRLPEGYLSAGQHICPHASYVDAILAIDGEGGYSLYRELGVEDYKDIKTRHFESMNEQLLMNHFIYEKDWDKGINEEHYSWSREGLKYPIYNYDANKHDFVIDEDRYKNSVFYDGHFRAILGVYENPEFKIVLAFNGADYKDRHIHYNQLLVPAEFYVLPKEMAFCALHLNLYLVRITGETEIYIRTYAKYDGYLSDNIHWGTVEDEHTYKYTVTPGQSPVYIFKNSQDPKEKFDYFFVVSKSEFLIEHEDTQDQSHTVFKEKPLGKNVYANSWYRYNIPTYNYEWVKAHYDYNVYDVNYSDGRFEYLMTKEVDIPDSINNETAMAMYAYYYDTHYEKKENEEEKE